MVEELKLAMEQRQAAYDNYQMNLNNFRLAISEIDTNFSDDTDMQEFKKTLENHVIDTVREQKKEFIMLTVIQKQLSDMEKT